MIFFSSLLVFRYYHHQPILNMSPFPTFSTFPSSVVSVYSGPQSVPSTRVSTYTHNATLTVNAFGAGQMHLIQPQKIQHADQQAQLNRKLQKYPCAFCLFLI